MSKANKVSVTATAEQLARELGGVSPKRRVLLVSGLRNSSELKKFLRSVIVPNELVPQVVGNMFGYTNLDVTIPTGTLFYVIELLGVPDLWWKIISKAALKAGYLIADVRNQQILIHGHEDEPISVSACTGVLHNVYADRV